MVKIKLPLTLKIIIALILFVIGYIAVSSAMRMVYLDEIVTSEDRLRAIIAENVSHYRTDITFRTTLEPSQIDYDSIFRRIVETDTYIGAEIYSFYYQYRADGDCYLVKLQLKDPAAHRVFFTKQRVKQIVKYIDGMTDYDKVKAVHDYIILSNEYSRNESGAFNTFYVGRSACNGYAYSFYAIMKEIGIPVTCEFGNSHAWNKVQIDGEWYNIDLTWDDLGGNNVGYAYFLKSDADWAGHHHGGATATKSLEPTGRSAMENFRAIPDFRFLFVVVSVLIAAGLIVLIKFASKIEKKEKKVVPLKVYSIEDNKMD